MAHDSNWASIRDDDLARYEAAGFGGETGIGDRPALLVIDVQYRTTGNTPKPFYESVREDYRTSCGDVAWAAIDRIQLLLEWFREYKFPVIFPHVAPKERYDAGRLTAKVPTIVDIESKGYEFVESVSPSSDDILLPKRHPSAFFGTPLASYLIDASVDTLVIVGCTTSGCVRATVVDGFSLNYRILVPSDAVYDRSDLVHEVSLFDIAQKYGDVTTTQEAIKLLSGTMGS